MTTDLEFSSESEKAGGEISILLASRRKVPKVVAGGWGGGVGRRDEWMRIKESTSFV